MNTAKKEYSALYAEIMNTEKTDVITTSGFDGDDHIIKRSNGTTAANLFTDQDVFDL